MTQRNREGDISTDNSTGKMYWKLLLEDTEGDRICDDLAGLKHIFLSFSKLSAITSRQCHKALVEITFQRSFS